MASIIRQRVVWTGVAGSPYYSNFYALAADTTPGDLAAAVSELLDSLVTYFDNSLTATVEGEVVTLDSVTGDATGFSTGAPDTIVGGAAGDPAASVLQALVRLRTDEVANGRRIAGRFFFPGITQTHVSAGRPSTALRSALDVAWSAYINDATISPVVWSRTTGLVPLIVSADTWAEFAVLRSRRD